MPHSLAQVQVRRTHVMAGKAPTQPVVRLSSGMGCTLKASSDATTSFRGKISTDSTCTCSPAESIGSSAVHMSSAASAAFASAAHCSAAIPESRGDASNSDLEGAGAPRTASETNSASFSNPGAPQLERRHWPDIDWSRYHLQVLFVDRTDTLRARLACGIFDCIAEWNGFGRALYTWSAGTYADPQKVNSMDRMATLMSAAHSSLGLLPRFFARNPEPFDVDMDLDRFDLVIALDRDVLATIVERMEGYNETEIEAYKNKLCLLTLFSSYEVDSTVLATGGLALLPRQLSTLLRPHLLQSKTVVDIVQPQLAGPGGQQAWDEMVQALVLANAGLVKYLMDALDGSTLPEYDSIE